MNILHPLWAEININNLKDNIKNIKSRIGNSDIIGIVKCNAYGHGSIEISKILSQSGIKKLAVANIYEAIELRENNINSNIMILGVTPEEGIETLIEYNIEPAIINYEFASLLNEKAKKCGKILNAHIALDTGMGRIGFIPNLSSIDEVVKIMNMDNLKISSIFSHFSSADELNKEYSNLQLDKYNWFFNELSKYNIPFTERNICNSAGLIDLPQSHYENVRAGISMYGYYPSNEVDKSKLDIKPILTLKTKIIHLKTMEKGQYLGYGRSHKITRKSIIATIPIGYGDGYSRDLSKKGYVIINGKLAPILGNVCMDQCMVDVTDIGNVNLYDEVILIGKDNGIKFDCDDIASLTGTINYEPLTQLGRRIPRVYKENNEVISIKHFM